jgi:hypothetical protein
VPSTGPAVRPNHIDAVATDKTGRAQRLYSEASMRACTEEAAAGDLGTLIVTAGTDGWAEPELEVDGLSSPLVRCLMGYVRESLDAMPMTPDTVIYVSVR